MANQGRSFQGRMMKELEQLREYARVLLETEDEEEAEEAAEDHETCLGKIQQMLAELSTG